MMRQAVAAHLKGDGLDLGPGHMPYPAPKGGTIRYIDRLTVQEHLLLFPELAGNKFPTPDAIVDFDTEWFTPFESADFVVLSHVIEHLADPLGMLNEIRRVLRPGGIAAVVVPDRRYTFDQGRPGTTFEHLIGDLGATRVCDEHIVEALEAQARFFAGTPLEPIVTLSESPDVRATQLEWHRRRSVHAHCWTADEFAEVVAQWNVVERIDGESEFGYILAK